MIGTGSRVLRNANGVFSSLASLAILFTIALSTTTAKAVPINYGDFSGTTVDYLQVTEDANSAGDTPPLFGPPTVSGDSIDFDPVGFSASTADGGSDITDGNLRFGIQAKPGKAITNVVIAEAGDVTLAGFGSDTTFASVTTRIFVDVLEVDGVAINVVSDNNISIPFSPSGGTYGLGTDGGGGPLYSSAWAGSVNIDVNAILTANNVPFSVGATRVSINLDNTLTAISQTGTSTLIAKKNANGITITVNIPEPSTCLLAGFAIVGFAMSLRRA